MGELRPSLSDCHESKSAANPASEVENGSLLFLKAGRADRRIWVARYRTQISVADNTPFERVASTSRDYAE